MEKFFSAIRKKRETAESEPNDQTVLIVGLGNPGREYSESRHNFGFMIVDRLSSEFQTEFSKVQCKALIATARYEGKKILLAKPQTYMNLSGQSVIPLLNYYKISQENLLVIHDDLDLPFGTLRMRPSGGNGGQKGVGSIIEQLGNPNFARLRCGIDHPSPHMDVKDYVLQRFSTEEQKILPEVINKAAQAAQTFITHGLQEAMNRFNGVLEK